MIRFPISDLLDEHECYAFLRHSLHPDGLCCPRGHGLPMGQAPHMRDRAPVVDYRCRECGAVFNLFTGTVWAGTHYSCAKIVLILRGFVQGEGFFESTISTVAAPVRDHSGRVVAAINVSSQPHRQTVASMQQHFLPRLQAVAERIGTLMPR